MSVDAELTTGDPAAGADDETRWRAVLDRISGEIDHRQELIAAGELRELRAPSFDVPDDLGPAPAVLVPKVHELIERLATQQAAIEDELTAIGRELARTAAERRAAPPRSVDVPAPAGFEARA